MGSVTPPLPSSPSRPPPSATLPYWAVNVHPSPAVCPPFLRNLNPKDIAILSTPDSQYHVLSWPEVQHIIATNTINVLQRMPSELRRYMEFNYELKKKYGSVMRFILLERLGWGEDAADVVSDGSRFDGEADVKVLWNDWPYGIDERIVHLVVWTKFELESDPETDDVTDESRKEIQAYVDKTFVSKFGKENVIWFKNWKSLKSVHAVEHFHVMLFDPDLEIVGQITNGDSALSKRM